MLSRNKKNLFVYSMEEDELTSAALARSLALSVEVPKLSPLSFSLSRSLSLCTCEQNETMAEKFLEGFGFTVVLDRGISTVTCIPQKLGWPSMVIWVPNI